MSLFKHTCISAICLLTACTTPQRTTIEPSSQTTPPKTETQEMTHHSKIALASSITSWQLSGAMAAKNAKKGWTASLDWKQQGPNRYQIRLFGPLGGGTVIIEKHGNVITYQDGPKTITSTNADELLAKKTGVRLPVKNLYYWIRGLPAPGSVTSSNYDTEKRLISLNQAGYNINYTAYTSIKSINLPSKIRLEGHGVMLKLVIKHWEF